MSENRLGSDSSIEQMYGSWHAPEPGATQQPRPAVTETRQLPTEAIPALPVVINAPQIEIFVASPQPQAQEGVPVFTPIPEAARGGIGPRI